MKRFFKSHILLIIFIIIQTIIYIIVGGDKGYLHIDEAYSFGLTHYDKVDIQDNSDFFNNWHDKEYYDNYLVVQENDSWGMVYENQKNDVHPPLFYLLLRIGMEFTKGQFSMWSGIILNIIIYAFITIFMYLISRKLLENEIHAKEKSAIFAFASSLTLASLSNITYIRMYSLLSLEILITLFLHIKLLNQEKVNKKILFLIGIIVLAGILTHYYYLFYLVFLYLIFIIKYIKEKNYKMLISYTTTMVISGILSLIIFPYSINHMFFGYRGDGVINNFKNISNLIISNVLEYIRIINIYGFNELLYIIIAFISISILYIKILKKEKIETNKNILKIIIIPVLFFFVIVAVASPWRLLRYMVAIFALIFIILIYYLYKLLKIIFGENKTNIIMIILFLIMLINPILLKIKPELLFSDKKEFIKKLNTEYNVPCIYFQEGPDIRFLDNILLYESVPESYIAKDIEYSEQNIKRILNKKDISNGILVVLNSESDEKSFLEKIKKCTGLKENNEIQKLYECTVYYIK